MVGRQRRTRWWAGLRRWRRERRCVRKVPRLLLWLRVVGRCALDHDVSP
ncbi:hypothetical protein OG777_06045 [Micromonospora peucetia]|uniref:Uncharacterized protein n=1 Tax=Micromonospora peucetia TaxID=47871 RepID=A0ABZ1EHX8_9ACTN|nr:hypothetical protein [Micromonospora peucetia]MCX4386490.1 hypothetical protein [Micromonospora peucetia]WSA33825.1 hypothetical protein OIE14_07185 [Micromonospora peucetia]